MGIAVTHEVKPAGDGKGPRKPTLEKWARRAGRAVTPDSPRSKMGRPGMRAASRATGAANHDSLPPQNSAHIVQLIRSRDAQGPPMPWFRHHYHCEGCDGTWMAQAAVMVEGDCPFCGARDVFAYRSEDWTLLVEQSGAHSRCLNRRAAPIARPVTAGARHFRTARRRRRISPPTLAKWAQAWRPCRHGPIARAQRWAGPACVAASRATGAANTTRSRRKIPLTLSN